MVKKSLWIILILAGAISVFAQIDEPLTNAGTADELVSAESAEVPVQVSKNALSEEIVAIQRQLDYINTDVESLTGIDDTMYMLDTMNAQIERLRDDTIELGRRQREAKKMKRKLERRSSRLEKGLSNEKYGWFWSSWIGRLLMNTKITILDNADSWGDLLGRLAKFLGILLFGSIVGWIGGRLVIKNILRVIRFDDWADKVKISTFLEGGGLKNVPSTAVGNLVYWIVMFFAFSIAISEIAQEGAAFQAITGLFYYLPRTFLAIFLLIIGVALGDFFKKIIKSMAVNAGTRPQIADMIGLIMMLFIVIFSIFGALNALKLSSQVIKNITDHAISYILLGLAIALALGGRHMASDFIAYFKLKKAYPKGTSLTIDNKKGVIKEVNLFYSIMYTEEGVVNIPNHSLARKISVREA